MSKTPEGRVKDEVKKRLIEYGLLPITQAADHLGDVEGFFFMPVATLGSVWGIHDFVGCWRGTFFSIETKSPANHVDATEPQLAFQAATRKSGGISLVGVRSPAAVDHLRNLIYPRRKS